MILTDQIEKSAAFTKTVGQTMQTAFDVVIPLSDITASQSDYSKLRYALRSAKTNLRGLGKIWIVAATLPNWLDPALVRHVQVSDLSDCRR